MFWDTVCQEANTLVELLKEPDSLELNVLLSDSFVLQELRSGNRQLIDYLTRTDILMEIVRSSLEVETEKGPKEEYKKAMICRDILTVRNNEDIIDALIQCDEAVDILIKSIADMEKLKPVTAGFFKDIIIFLLERRFDTALVIMKNSNFLEKCLQNMEMCPVSQLLQDVIKVPSLSEDINRLKEFLVEENFASRLVNLLEPSRGFIVHSNAAAVFIEILRTLRDYLYSFDEKDDTLHDTMFTEELITQMVSKMLERNSEGFICPHTLSNCSEMLEALLETNYDAEGPKHRMERGCGGEWTGGTPGETRESETEFWRPDKDRIVELAVAKRSSDLTKIILDDLEKLQIIHDMPRSPLTNWKYALNLLTCVCNTASFETQELLVAGFREAEFSKVFAYLYKHPELTVLHSKLKTIVSLMLYSGSQEQHPLLSYLFEECKIIDILKNGIQPVCVLRKLSMKSLLSFHIFLAIEVLKASKVEPSGSRITLYLIGTEWEAVANAVQIYVTQNPCDNWQEQELVTVTITSDSADTVNGMNGLSLEENFDSYSALNDKIEEYRKLDPTKRIPVVETPPTEVKCGLPSTTIERNNFKSTIDFDFEGISFKATCRESSFEEMFNDDTPGFDQITEVNACSMKSPIIKRDLIDSSDTEESSGEASLTSPAVLDKSETVFDMTVASPSDLDNSATCATKRASTSSTKRDSSGFPLANTSNSDEWQSSTDFFNNSSNSCGSRVSTGSDTWANFSASMNSSDLVWPGAEETTQSIPASDDWPSETPKEDPVSNVASGGQDLFSLVSQSSSVHSLQSDC